MKKLITMLCALFACTAALQAQNVDMVQPRTNTYWPSLAAGSNIRAELNSFINSVTIGSQVYTAPAIGADSIGNYLAVYNLQGQLQWSKQIHKLKMLSKIKADNQDNIIVAAVATDSLYIDSLLLKPVSAQPGNVVLLKFSPAGTLLWNRTITSSQLVNEARLDLDIDSAGNIYLSGLFSGSIQFGTNILNAASSQDVFVAKYAAAGNVMWVDNPVASGVKQWPSLAVSKAGNVHLSFLNNWNTINVGINLVKYNATGSIVYNMPAVSQFFYPEVVVDSRENIYIIGSNHQASLPVGGFIFFKVNTNTATQQIQFFGNASTGDIAPFNNVVIDASDHIWVTGSLQGSFNFNTVLTSAKNTIPATPSPFLNNPNGFILRMDTTGAFTWSALNYGVNNRHYTLVADNRNNYIYYTGQILEAGTVNLNGQLVNNIKANSGYWARVNLNFNKVQGTVFADLNQNGIQDASESGINGILVSAAPQIQQTYSDTSGNYRLDLLSGNYNIQLINPPKYYTVSPVLHSVSFAGINQSIPSKNFALVPVSTINDASISLTNYGASRAVSQNSYHINVTNTGTTVLSDTIVLFFDDQRLSFEPGLTTILPDVVLPGQLKWYYTNLEPLRKISINAGFRVKKTALLNDTIKAMATTGPHSTDQYLQDNTARSEQVVLSNFDPNNKQVEQKVLTPAKVTSDAYLDYTIRFQNIGTDTAFTVTVHDTLPNNVHVSTLEMLSASHDYSMSVNEKGIVSWCFDVINLPDSTTNLSASQGFIRFKIKPLATLQLGDSITNKAAIYFDYYSPVITNTAVTRIQNPTAINKNIIKNIKALNVYPNPATESFIVEAELEKAQPVTLTLRNLLGQQLQAVHIGEQQKVQYKLDVQQLPKGVYLLQLQGGAEIITQRVVLQ